MPSPILTGDSFLAMYLNAPLVGIHPNAKQRVVLHCLTIDELPGPKHARGVAVCGKRGLKPMALPHGDTVLAVPFPPQKRGLPERMERCDECWAGNGKRRPRITIKTGKPEGES